jgi:uncharacterized protein YjiS (DUF1127 family)
MLFRGDFMMIPGRLDAGTRLSSVEPWLCGARGGSTRPANGNTPNLFVFDRVVHVVSTWRARARTHAAVRQSLSCLARLDDHTLRDIGLNRVDLYREVLKPPRYGV